MLRSFIVFELKGSRQGLGVFLCAFLAKAPLLGFALAVDRVAELDDILRWGDGNATEQLLFRGGLVLANLGLFDGGGLDANLVEQRTTSLDKSVDGLELRSTSFCSWL